MAYTESGDNTIFTYAIDKLLARVRNRTGNQTKMLRDPAGKQIYDQTALTDMEEPDFNVLYPQAAAYVFETLQSLAQGVDDAFAWDTTEITFILELPEYWDPNKTPIMDLQVFSVLVYWICREWFITAGMPSLYQEFDLLLTGAQKDLKVSVVSRTYRATRKYRSL